MNIMQTPFLADMVYELRRPLPWEYWNTLPPVSNESDSTKLIMVINDDHLALDAIATRLQNDGYHVFAVANSRYALAQARILQPSAIVLDIRSSYGDDGWATLDELNHDSELAHIPVLLYSTTMQLQPGF